MTDHTTNEIPYGYCHCGCGEKTSISPCTDRYHGWTKGQPRRYLIGHHKRKNELDRFWSKVDKRSPDECWGWTAHKVDLGYGGIMWQGKKRHASRVSYIIHFGPIPDSLNVCHRCDNPTCVNPAHLFLGTQKENMDDMHQKGRHPHGKSHGVAKLTGEQATEIRQRYATGNISQRKLAAEYGVSQKTIANVIKRKIWLHVP